MLLNGNRARVTSLSAQTNRRPLLTPERRLPGMNEPSTLYSPHPGSLTTREDRNRRAPLLLPLLPLLPPPHGSLSVSPQCRRRSRSGPEQGKSMHPGSTADEAQSIHNHKSKGSTFRTATRLLVF